MGILPIFTGMNYTFKDFKELAMWFDFYSIRIPKAHYKRWLRKLKQKKQLKRN